MNLSPPPARRTGLAATAAGALLFVSVAAELVWPAQQPDGSLTKPGLYFAYLTAWVVGAGALLLALRDVGNTPDGSPPDLRRGGRIGRRLSLAGAALLLAFGVVSLASALATGAPAEASFLLFALGLLLTIVGQAMLALGLRRSRSLGGWWVALLVAAFGALVAVVAVADPWHDLGMFTFDAAWVALGAGLLARGRSRASLGSLVP